MFILLYTTPYFVILNLVDQLNVLALELGGDATVGLMVAVVSPFSDQFSERLTGSLSALSSRLRLSSYFFDKRVPNEEMSSFSCKASALLGLLSSLRQPERFYSSQRDGFFITVPSRCSVYASLNNPHAEITAEQNGFDPASRIVYIPSHFLARICVVCVLLWLFVFIQVAEMLLPGMSHHMCDN